MSERSWTCPHCRGVFPSGLHAYFCPEKDYPIARAEQAEAAIQRVQAVCDKPNPGPSWDSYVEGYNDAISLVQAAMEGDVDA